MTNEYEVKKERLFQEIEKRRLHDMEAALKETDNVATFCKAFASPKRIALIIGLLRGVSPVKIAEILKISRAGLQKHLDVYFTAGLVVKKGSGRTTRYVPAPVVTTILAELDRLTEITRLQHRINKLRSAQKMVKIASEENPLLKTTGIPLAENIQSEVDGLETSLNVLL